MVVFTRTDGETKIAIVKSDILRIEEAGLGEWCTTVICKSGEEIKVAETFNRALLAYRLARS